MKLKKFQREWLRLAASNQSHYKTKDNEVSNDIQTKQSESEKSLI